MVEALKHIPARVQAVRRESRPRNVCMDGRVGQGLHGVRLGGGEEGRKYHRTRRLGLDEEGKVRVVNVWLG